MKTYKALNSFQVLIIGTMCYSYCYVNSLLESFIIFTPPHIPFCRETSYCNLYNFFLKEIIKFRQHLARGTVVASSFCLKLEERGLG